MSRGTLCLVLHAHLPYVRHPEHEDFLEEDWLFEAITEAYVPVWSRLTALHEEGVRFGITLTLSPTLAAMLDDSLLRKRLHRYLDRLRRLAESQATRHGDALPGQTARQTVAQCLETEAFLARYKDDLLAPLRSLQAEGAVEIVACNATHGLLPLMSTTGSKRAQLRTGVQAHARNFGRKPRGLWLAECGYELGLDERLAEDEVELFFVDAAAVERGRPPSPFGLYAPVKTVAGVAAFARDHETGRQVWSAHEGYPGNGAYREFHRDFGHEAPIEELLPFLPADGRRRALGLKLHRVTGRDVPLGDKALYDPEAARLAAMADARAFVAARRAQVQAHAGGQAPVITACYDAELFGHWWYEGPAFLEEVLRLLASDTLVETACVTTVVDRARDGELTMPPMSLAPSTWGAESSHKVWLNPETTWVYPALHQAEARMQRLARLKADGLRGRAVRQAGRELLLAQSSDWTFLITLGTAPAYGAARLREHLDAFNALATAIEADEVREAELSGREARTPLFPDLDVSAWL